MTKVKMQIVTTNYQQHQCVDQIVKEDNQNDMDNLWVGHYEHKNKKKGVI